VEVNGLPKEGDTYRTFHSGVRNKKNGGPFYNVSVTLDKHCLGILERQQKGSRSEYIRWALKDYHLRGHESQARIIQELEEAIERHLLIQARLRQEIIELQDSRKRNVTLMGKMMALIDRLLLRTRA
jgi:metal-responsive CopG/Arc/MetJ family transcriptional regulator